MATRAEMQAELETLRAKLAERDARGEPAPAPTPPEKTDEKANEKTDEKANDGDAPPAPPDRAAPDARESEADVRSELDRLLHPLGVSSEELDALADQFWKELDSLPQNKPLLTAIGAFGLGFVLGRMTR